MQKLIIMAILYFLIGLTLVIKKVTPNKRSYWFIMFCVAAIHAVATFM